ncbi:type I glyceraldehyde-3-phosphate dehydrogenase [Muricauda sp. CAU 1633]|uniref:type I glyceraldehyde-3-phosphate dehydrogenase n=1 Tax=Allomuricauda sp. CAU 1633 TaxID=2816036 RepID=UPI001A8E8D48|nr:glyceraldehyde 3-phosphate dehydrogenase NAD-binding domain-containing protein [Muricauda sp. CAU 1633]MBO0322244.1 type I glyceraldehyde-3-phosphate dehydrogenase [Muricauda sp. CAU 1633]
MKKIGINGMGRIGRASLKIIMDTPGLEVVAVNDIAPLDNIAYLLQYDSVHGKLDRKVSVSENVLTVGDHEIRFYSEREPKNIPWKEIGVDTVIESTGVFTKEEDASMHIEAGAKTVVISGPTKSVGVPTVVHGVNTSDGKVSIFSCASCTTNNISPVIEILGRRIGIKKAIMTTIHADTASNSIVDSPSGNVRMGRSGLNNIIPTTTGAAVATTKAMPEYAGKFDGMAFRVPVAVGSASDITLVTERKTSVDEVNAIFREEAASPRYKGVFEAVDQPLVSSDIVKDPHASIADLSMTKVVDGDLLKVVTWYDNEWGFANQMIRQILDN